MKKWIAVLLICSIIMGIVLYGSTYTYDFETHLNKIAEIGEELPSLDAVVDIWDDNAYSPHRYGLPYVFPYYAYNMPGLPSGTSMPNALFQIDPNGDWGVFDVVRDFFNGSLLIVQQTMYTASFFVEYLFGVLKVVARLSPTAGIIPRT